MIEVTATRVDVTHPGTRSTVTIVPVHGWDQTRYGFRDGISVFNSLDAAVDNARRALRREHALTAPYGRLQ